MDSMVVPGGRVELSMQWAIRFYPEEHSDDSVVVSSMPLFPLPEEERDRIRNRTMWLMDFIEEERAIQRQRIERGEFPTQEQHQAFYRLDQAIDYLILQQDGMTLDDVRLRIARVARLTLQEEETEDLESMLESLQKPLDVVHTATLQDVKRNLEKWKPSIYGEMDNLVVTTRTLREIPLQEAKDKAARGELVLVPSKTVHTVKPPSDPPANYKRKTRLVICGNFIKGDVEVYTAAANAESVRCALGLAAHRQWSAAVCDINAAFTLTPMTESDVNYAITVPRVITDAGYVGTDKAYILERVLYGLREAPRLWGGFRDRRISDAVLYCQGAKCRFVQMNTDPAVWRPCAEDDQESTLALMVIYVDDVMFLGNQEAIQVMYDWLTKGGDDQEGWKCSKLEHVGSEAVRYLGMEVRSRCVCGKIQYHVSQGGYIADLLRSYPHEAAKPGMIPATKELLCDEEEEDCEGEVREEPDESLVKSAQKTAGELLWLMSRTRPDIGFATVHVCMNATKRPQVALDLGKYVIRYLAATKDVGLTFGGDGPPVLAYSDSSYAPSGNRSFGCSATSVFGGFVAWKMGKQPTISLSSAESELYELVNAYQQSAGIKAWLDEVQPTKDMKLRVDNQAAVGLATTAPGSWKTRHLKTRCRFIRQEYESGRLDLAFTPGEVQAADMGTKPVPLPRLRELCRQWNTQTVAEFLEKSVEERKEDEVNVGLCVPANVVRLMMMMVLIQRGQAAEIYAKPPIPPDGSIEFYFLVMLAGVALLGVWEGAKWMARKLWSDELQEAKIRKLARIREETSRAVREELATMSSAASSTSPPTAEGSQTPQAPLQVTSTAPPRAQVPTVETPRTQQEAVPPPRQHDDQDLREVFEGRDRRQRNLVRFDQEFYMSEHGDRIHLSTNCHGLRHANQARMKRLRLCHYCDQRHPLHWNGPPQQGG